MSPPPSGVSSAPAGWNGRNDMMTVVNSTAARMVAIRLAGKASARKPTSVLVGLPVLLIGVAEFGERAPERDIDRVTGDRWRSSGGKSRQRAERRGGEQRQAAGQDA